MEIFTVKDHILCWTAEEREIIFEKWGGYASEDNDDLHAPILQRRHLKY